MEDDEADVLALFGDAGADAGAAQGDAAAAGVEYLVAVAVDIEAEDLALLRIGAEDGADSVVRSHLFESDAHVGDIAAVDFGAVLHLGDVALGLFEDGKKVGFESDTGFSEELGGELEDTARVGDDLHGLDAGDFVEEPAA